MEFGIFLLCLTASTLGSLCGMGGGIIIKPLLDFCSAASISSINFYSGCTVLCMALYSVASSLLSKEKVIDYRLGSLLAAGALLGGVAGKHGFSLLCGMLTENFPAGDHLAGGIQSVLLAAVTALTLLYVRRKKQVESLQISSRPGTFLIGTALGAISSFLGIGGGSINLVVLHYFFSMETKKAAHNSIYIILLSQAASLVTGLATNDIPPFQTLPLFLMSAGGISGGILGRRINRRITEKQLDILFMALMLFIIGISVCNTYRFFSPA